MVDAKDVMTQLRPEWLADFPAGERDHGEELLSALAADWAGEANRSDDPPAVIQILRDELTKAAGGKSPAERLKIFQHQLLNRQILRLRARSYALGTAVIDGKIARDEARRQGEAMLQEIGALDPQVRDNPVLLRGLNEARMEALYAVEEKAMSLRLGHYLDSKKR